MPETNPYESPPESHESLPPPAHEPRQPSRRGGQDMLPFAQLGLRLLGVMFVVHGAASLIGTIAQSAGLASDTGVDYITTRTLPWLVGPTAYLAAGLYLAIGGHWVLEKVFMPGSGRAEYDDEPGDMTTVESATHVNR